MKVFIIGHRGWISQKYIKLFNDNKIDYTYSNNYRAESLELQNEILLSKSSHVLCCMGRTHGILGDKVYTTIDYLEHPSRLTENVNDNLFAPTNLALFCKKHNIHFTYIGTGCIFNYDDKHTIENMVGFNEDDKPNFFGSNYSIVKGYTDRLMATMDNVLNLRIRMPITHEDSSRNFITKITNYEKICSIPNSMSVLSELIPISINMMKSGLTGTYNLTNPGYISHNEILEMYKEIVDPSFTWKNFSLEEQDKILLSKRSNNLLDTTKLENLYKVKHIKDAVRNVLERMKNNKNL